MQDYRKNFVAALAILIFAASLLSVRLWQLQILKGDEYESFSRHNRIRFVRVPAPRGRILDRNGKEFVRNRPSFDLYINLEYVVDAERLTIDLSRITSIPPEAIREKLDRAHTSSRFGSVLIAKDIGRDVLAQVEPRRSTTLRGVEIEVNHVRQYPNGSTGAQFLGYVGMVTEGELRENERFKKGDLVGKTGVEKEYERYLRGRDGVRQIATDALGRVVDPYLFKEDFVNVDAVAGNDVVLTVDLDLQREAEAALGDKAGAVVVVEVGTGRILALASSPSFNPDIFVTGIEEKEWKALLNDKRSPMINRATQGAYAPGSVFKIISAVGLLEEGVVDADTQFYCPGYYRIGSYVYRCWKRSGHGWVNLHRALVESCDVYFYTAVEKLGIDRLSRYMGLFGLGRPTGIGIAERAGVSPNRRWKREVKGKPWYHGDTVLTAIGQGYVGVTPLQIAMMTSAVANGGKMMKPLLVGSVVGHSGEVVDEFPPQTKYGLKLSASTLKQLRSALVDAVNGPKGTGRAARLRKVVVAGKTGTAQVVSNKSRLDVWEHNDHGWFTSYAPSDSPEIAVTVLVEHGGGGGKVAAPIARRILEFYFKAKEGGEV